MLLFPTSTQIRFDLIFLPQIAVSPDSSLPNLGSSGAIAGVLGAYVVLFPWARVRTVIFLFIFFSIVMLPALVLIGLWFVLQFFDGVASLTTTQQNMGGVAYVAHSAGFVTGLLITLLVRPRLQPPPPVSYPSFPPHPQGMGPLQW
jgi:membrane associated rhomboid family serine protease